MNRLFPGFRARPVFPAVLACGSLLLGGCVSFDFTIPTKGDLTFDLAPAELLVFEHEPPDEDAKAYGARYKEVVRNRRNRMAEIQALKDDRVIGENHEGLVEVQEDLTGTGWENEMEYIRKTVKAENGDRNFIIDYETRTRTKTEAEIRELIWRQRQRKSSPGEWIEVRSEDGEAYKWIQKPGAPR